MARESVAYILAFVSAVVFTQQIPLCSYRRTQGGDNTTRAINNGTIEEEGRFFITWKKPCGSESLRFTCQGSCVVALSIVETFPTRSCSDIYVLDSLTLAYVGVAHTCPAGTHAETFQSKELQLRFEGIGNDTVQFEVTYFIHPSISTGFTLFSTSLNQRLKIFSVLARDNPQTVGDPVFPGTTVWNVTASKFDHKVSVRVLQADGLDCTATELRVYDGASLSQGNLLGSFCDARPFFLSSAASLTVVLHTNLTQARGSFLLSYAQVPQALACLPCNTTFTIRGQLNVTSPGFPNPYPDRLDCWWRIQVPAYASISVQSQLFLLQPPSVLDSCTDWLGFGFNEDNSSALVDKRCGYRQLSGFYRRDSVLLWFHSEDSITAPGFSLSVTLYLSDGLLYCDPGHVKEVVLGQARYEVTLQAPECFLQLRASGQVVRLWASKADVDPGSAISCKNLFVYDGPSKASPQLIHWCGDSALDVRSTGKYMYVEYNHLATSVQLFAISEEVAMASGFNIAGLVAAVLCSVIFVIICVLCCVGCCRVCSRKQTRRRWSAIARPNVALSGQNRGHRQPPQSERMATVSERVAQGFVASPPPYEAAVSGTNGASPPPYSTIAENRVAQELPPVDQEDKPPAYSEVGMDVEA